MILDKYTISSKHNKMNNKLEEFIESYDLNKNSSFVSCLSILTEMNNNLAIIDKENLIATTKSKNVNYSAKKAVEIKNVFTSIRESLIKFINKVQRMVLSDDKYIASHRSVLNEFTKEDTFKVSGYDYTISVDDTKHLYKLFDDLADKVEVVYKDCIHSRNPEDILNSFKKFYKNNITSTSEEYLREIRSYILHKNTNGKYISQDKFIEETNKKFRNGTLKESMITVDKAFIDCLVKHHPKDCVEKVYDAIIADANRCSDSLNRTLFYLDAIDNKANRINNFNNPLNANLEVAIASFCNKVYNNMIVTLTEETNMYIGIECDAIYEMAYFYTDIMKKAIDKKLDI